VHEVARGRTGVIDLGMRRQPDSWWESELGDARLIYGEEALAQIGELTRWAGGTRALVVTDAGVRDAGHVEKAVEALSAQGVAAFVFDGVEPNPTTRHVAETVEVARRERIDCIVGLGGGSSMDCAKGANFLLTNGGKMEDYWGTGKALQPMLPSVGVPTTAGTGSEAQSYALISQEKTHVKMACGDRKARFRAVILDPVTVATAPRSVASVSAIDAMSHAIESYVTRVRNPVSQLFAREAWRLLDANVEVALDGTADVVGWGAMQLGAHLAGAAIERSMLGAAHACANPLTANYGTEHGVAVGLMLPHVIRFNAARVGHHYEELQAVIARGVSLEERVVQLCRAAGLPGTLGECGVPRDSLAELAEQAERQWTAGFNPREVTRDDLLALYEAAY
jgi:alcohol dehydrogenase